MKLTKFLCPEIVEYLLPEVAATNFHKLGGLTEQNFMSYGFGKDQKSEIKVLAGLVLSGGSEGESIPGLPPGFWWILVFFFGLWQLNSNLCVHHHVILYMVFSPVSVSVWDNLPLLLLIGTLVSGFRTHLNPG